MTKYRFQANTWIIYEYKGKTAIGRAIYGVNGEQAVATVLENGSFKYVLYKEVEAPRKLVILSKNNHRPDKPIFSLNGFPGGNA